MFAPLNLLQTRMSLLYCPMTATETHRASLVREPLVSTYKIHQCVRQ
jgi:hypothetical protein